MDRSQKMSLKELQLSNTTEDGDTKVYPFFGDTTLDCGIEFPFLDVPFNLTTEYIRDMPTNAQESHLG